MGGADKYWAGEEIKSYGWEEVDGEHHRYRPSKEIVEKFASMTFYVYTAQDISYWLDLHVGTEYDNEE